MGMEVFSKILAFLSDQAWPLIFLVALILFRKPLGGVLLKLMKLNVEAGKFKLETSMQEYVPPSVLNEIMKNPGQLRLGGERRHVTILCADIRGFTQTSEVLEPQVIAGLLHRYLTSMTEIVFSLDGTLDSYRGHVLTAYWGAPVTYADSAARACEAALRMVASVGELNPLMTQQGLAPLRLNIGITTGDVVVGNFGSDQRFNYSVLGDVLEILPRLVALNLQYQTDIVLTEYTQREMGPGFSTSMVAENLRVKGKTEPIRLYALEKRA